MVHVLSDPALYFHVGGQPPNLRQLRARYRRQVVGASPDGRYTWFNWIVRIGDDGRAVGYVQATCRDSEGEAELAWVIGRQWQGRGFATRAASLAIASLASRKIERFVARIFPENSPSIRLARRLGFRPTEAVVDDETTWVRD